VTEALMRKGGRMITSSQFSVNISYSLTANKADDIVRTRFRGVSANYHPSLDDSASLLREAITR
jgi:hypothetical protein